MAVDEVNVEELGRLEPESDESFAATVRCTLRNNRNYAARVALMAHRNHDLWEHRVVVGSGQSIPVACLTGKVVLVIFNVNSNGFLGCRHLNVTTNFTFDIP